MSKLEVGGAGSIENSKRLEAVWRALEQVSELYFQLVLVVGPVKSGKTLILGEMAQKLKEPLVNVNLALSSDLLELTDKQRAIEVPALIGCLSARANKVLILDNIELLFDASLKQDPLRLL